VRIVDREEVDRLRKRFMKLDKARVTYAGCLLYVEANATNRTILAQSIAKNSLLSPRFHPTRSPRE
jgi:hypothetical protein